MRSRRVLAALPVLAALAAGCQDYTFHPLAQCLYQPGSTRLSLPAGSSADILFVVDDSPSMDPKQAGLAASFGDFITRVVETNTDRVAHGLEPLDFHVGVTTTSVFMANSSGQACQDDGGSGQCCTTSACADVNACTPGTAQGCGAGQLCVTRDVVGSSADKVGEQAQCCSVSACAPSTPACHPGAACPSMVTSYPGSLSGCTPGLATAGAPYGQGALVAAAGNPPVLDFEKTLAWASWGTAAQDPALTRLVAQFRQNIQVGSCGSGEEQGLEAARLALQRAQAGQQPGVTPGTWPRPGSRLVVVWVGDEDDCSSPAAAPLVLAESAPGADSCVWDKHQPAAAQRETPVAEYAQYLAGIVGGSAGPEELAAAFIVSGVACQGGGFAPADSCSGTASCPVTPPASCTPAQPVCSGAYAAGERFQELADALLAQGRRVVEGSVCDAYPPATFGPTLAAIADLARPPSSLKLPSQPAADEVTVLRIVGADGTTRQVCQQGADWCFASCSDTSAAPACLATGQTSACIAVLRGGGCQANPGDTYSAEYLGMVPPGGCATAADCRAVLGDGADWSCYAAAGQTRGTCVCGQ